MTQAFDSGQRTPLAGDVDFTMMYVAHDAFARDLRRLSVACVTGSAWSPSTAARWATFKTQLHIHHTAEDDALWPRLRAAVSAPEEVAVLDAMEAEHAEIDPRLDAIDAALDVGDSPALYGHVRALSEGLGAHMRHEEDEALPLVAARLGRTGWYAFTEHIRKVQGLRGAAAYLPWLLDDAPAPTRRFVLGLLPPPARLLYRWVWAPRYRRAHAG